MSPKCSMPANFWSCRGCSGCFDADMGRVLITDCLHVRFWLVFCNSVGIEVGGRVYLVFWVPPWALHLLSCLLFYFCLCYLLLCFFFFLFSFPLSLFDFPVLVLVVLILVTDSEKAHDTENKLNQGHES